MTQATEVRSPRAVIHVPHASTVIPADIRRTFVLSDAELERELLLLTDRYTDELFDLRSELALSVVYGVSRFVTDPERFPDDAHEPMAARGMGAVYVSTTDGAPLRDGLTAPQRSDLLARFYQPHHIALEAAVQRVLDATGRCLIIDCHSFPDEPLPCDQDQTRPRPDVCIGTDAFHTPAELAAQAAAGFSDHGLEVFLDRPFSGAMVLARWYQQDKRVTSVMVEINRRLYMDEATGERGPGFSDIQDLVQSVLKTLIDDDEQVTT
jgi:N-formylglutamate deformylase